jgi:hypothetical protein
MFPFLTSLWFLFENKNIKLGFFLRDLDHLAQRTAFPYPAKILPFRESVHRLRNELLKVRIPLIPATHSGAKRSPVPEDSGRLFRAIPDTPSGWIDAGDVRFFA